MFDALSPIIALVFVATFVIGAGISKWLDGRTRGHSVARHREDRG